jgi:hypothetical protein
MATQFQNFKKLTREIIRNNRTPNWDEYPKIKDHWKSFVEYKKSEIFAQKTAQAKNSASKKGEYCRCLNLSTSMRGTRNKVEGEDRHDLEPEGTCEDTRHKIYTGSDS